MRTVAGVSAYGSMKRESEVVGVSAHGSLRRGRSSDKGDHAIRVDSKSKEVGRIPRRVSDFLPSPMIIPAIHVRAAILWIP